MLGTLPLSALAYAWMMRDHREKAARLDVATARISSAVVELITGIGVAERGTHAELLAANGRYAAFWREPRQGPAVGLGELARRARPRPRREVRRGRESSR
ncbi:hypothetical protein [Actinosynnema pretiosum]|uniref:hypothetical protein n=1 Tax=Actinosynnema pretiosum TaxID=42197 RepID=UPI0015A685FD|nr:hypothetical protein [Actinosynnema pretiosum]